MKTNNIVRGVDITATSDVPMLKRLHKEICAELSQDPSNLALQSERDRVEVEIEGWIRWARIN